MSALNSQPGADYGTAKQHFLEAFHSDSVPGKGKEGQLPSAVSKIAEELRVQVGSWNNIHKLQAKEAFCYSWHGNNNKACYLLPLSLNANSHCNTYVCKKATYSYCV